MWLPPCQPISAALGEMIDSPSTSAIGKPEKPGWKKVLLVSRQVDYTRRIYVFFFLVFSSALVPFCAVLFFFLLSVASFCWKIIRWTFFRHVPLQPRKASSSFCCCCCCCQGQFTRRLPSGSKLKCASRDTNGPQMVEGPEIWARYWRGSSTPRSVQIEIFTNLHLSSHRRSAA